MLFNFRIELSIVESNVHSINLTCSQGKHLVKTLHSLCLENHIYKAVKHVLVTILIGMNSSPVDRLLLNAD